MNNILFVCTGNTCRSPMAAALYNKMGGTKTAFSCGITAYDGMPAAHEAIIAANQAGCDLSSHRAMSVNSALVWSAKQIWCMSPHHAEAVKKLFPNDADRVFVFDPPVPDPFGQDLEAYIDALDLIRAGIEKIIGDENGSADC